MENKRNLLKIASLLEIIYVVINVIYYLLSNKPNDEIIANLFFSFMNLIVAFILFRESKKEVLLLKKNKMITLFCSIWLLMNSIIPGILGLLFLTSISDKKHRVLPENEYFNKKGDVLNSIFLIFLFIIIMFVFPLFNFSKHIPAYFIYIVIFLLVIMLNFGRLKNDLKLFVSNFKLYLPFVIKRYFIMLSIMVIVALPIVFLNKGAVSSNQQMLNNMFQKLPLASLVLSTIYAPFVEENVFRLSLSKVIKNKTLFIIISGFLFGILHMIDKFTSFNDLLYIFQYSALGICLAKAYYDSKNIFVSIGMHFLQNFLAAILILLLYI